MINVSKIPAVDILSIIREISGRADFIMIVLHDGDVKLNDPGDIAIPSRSKRSKCLYLHKSDLTLLNEIIDFMPKTFEISANGHLFGYWRSESEESAYRMICRESCTDEPMDTYQIIHHPRLDQLSDEEIYELNLREVQP